MFSELVHCLVFLSYKASKDITPNGQHLRLNVAFSCRKCHNIKIAIAYSFPNHIFL